MTYFHNFYLVLFPERFVVGCENTASAVAFNTVEGEKAGWRDVRERGRRSGLHLPSSHWEGGRFCCRRRLAECEEQGSPQAGFGRSELKLSGPTFLGSPTSVC